MIFKTTNNQKSKSHDFQKFKTTRSFGRDTYSGVITLNDVVEEQINLNMSLIIPMNTLNQKT